MTRIRFAVGLVLGITLCEKIHAFPMRQGPSQNLEIPPGEVEIPIDEWQAYIIRESPNYDVFGEALANVDKIQVVRKQGNENNDQEKDRAICPVFAPRDGQFTEYHIQPLIRILENAKERLEDKLARQRDVDDLNFYDDTNIIGPNQRVSVVSLGALDEVLRRIYVAQGNVENTVELVNRLPRIKRPGGFSESINYLVMALFNARPIIREEEDYVVATPSDYNFWKNTISNAKKNVDIAERTANDELDFVNIKDDKALPVVFDDMSWEDVLGRLVDWTNCWNAGIGNLKTAWSLVAPLPETKNIDYRNLIASSEHFAAVDDSENPVQDEVQQAYYEPQSPELDENGKPVKKKSVFRKMGSAFARPFKGVANLTASIVQKPINVAKKLVKGKGSGVSGQPEVIENPNEDLSRDQEPRIDISDSRSQNSRSPIKYPDYQNPQLGLGNANQQMGGPQSSWSQYRGNDHPDKNLEYDVDQITDEKLQDKGDDVQIVKSGDVKLLDDYLINDKKYDGQVNVMTDQNTAPVYGNYMGNSNYQGMQGAPVTEDRLAEARRRRELREQLIRQQRGNLRPLTDEEIEESKTNWNGPNQADEDT